MLTQELPPTPNYTKEEEQWAKAEKGIKEEGSWKKLPDQKLFVLSAVAAPLVKQHHGLAQLGKTALEKLLGMKYYFIPKFPPCVPKQVPGTVHVHKIMQVKDLNQAAGY